MKFLYYWSKILKKLRGSSIINSTIHISSKVESGSLIVNTTIDKHSFCGYDCQLINSKIGSYCSLSNNIVMGGGKHPLEWVAMSPVFYEGRDSVRAKFSIHKREKAQRITVGNDVWIGEKVLIKQGVKIGTGAVVGMGSVVTKDVPDYAIVGGNPARVIRMRFDKELIEALLQSKWWEYDDVKLKKYAQFFTVPQLFLSKLKEQGNK